MATLRLRLEKGPLFKIIKTYPPPSNGIPSPRIDTFFNEIDDLEKSRQVWKIFWCSGPKMCCFCAAGKPEKPRKMYSTKLFAFSDVNNKKLDKNLSRF